ncbi:hypothetical protein EHS25_007134 [Saitozyma podzolica]|uniref:Uncharacterized protein n=1 Tax=Saitozyma podzolica TaxID=1890683 RepID=A0A427XP97_9TREE|nr:hypothetical protein EHS25_007134 [Saitozyma podzolica]
MPTDVAEVINPIEPTVLARLDEQYAVSVSSAVLLTLTVVLQSTPSLDPNDPSGAVGPVDPDATDGARR